MRRLITFVVCCTALICSGQSFLSKYPELKKKELPKFFADWKAYSDSVSANNVVTDTLLQNIITRESVDLWEANESYDKSVRYRVIRQHIKVKHFYNDVDTGDVQGNIWFHLWTAEENDDYWIDTITPALPPNTLYLTPEIQKTLSEFLGGLAKRHGFTKIKKGNLKKLQKYIPIQYNVDGGSWWLNSFPVMGGIYYANNLITVVVPKSNHTGAEIGYIKENGEFVKRPKPISSWIIKYSR